MSPVYGMGPLLHRLGVRTFRDMLSVDLDLAATVSGVGRRKLDYLRSLQRAARARLGGAESRAGVGEPTANSPPVEPATRPLGLDDLMDPPPGVGPLLERLGVHTYRDLLALDLELVATGRGVGASKLDRLRQLRREAGARLVVAGDGARDEPVAVVPVELLPGPYEHLGIHEALGRLGKRATRVIADAGLRTIGELRAWLDEVDLRTHQGIGRLTVVELRERLANLAHSSPEALVFGGPVPASVQSFAERFLQQFEGKTLEILTQRLRDGATLGAVGEVFGITRERVRQIVDKQLAAYRRSWAPRAQALLAPAFELLQVRGGVAPTARVFGELEDPERWALDLALTIAEQTLHVDFESGLTAVGDLAALGALQRRLRTRATAVLEQSAAAEDVREVLRAEGLDGPDDELDDVAARWLRIAVRGDSATDGLRPVQSLCAQVLIEAGRPMTAAAIAVRAAQIDPGWCGTPNSVAGALGRLDKVFSHSRGYWVHESALQIEREQIDHFAALCLPTVRAAGGEAMSCHTLLRQLRDAGHELQDLTAHILRDALLHTGKVRSWRSGADVAWKAGEVRRKSIADWIAEAARARRTAFSIKELAEEIAEHGGFSAQAVIGRMPAADFVPCGAGRYLARSVLGLDDRALQRAAAAVHDALSPGEAWTAKMLVRRLPQLAQLVRRFGAGLVWGLGRLHDGVATRPGSSILWRRQSGASVWEVVGDGLLAQHPVFGIPTLAEWLAPTCGELPTIALHRLVAEGSTRGRILRLGRGLYLDAHLPREEQLVAIESDEAALTYVLGDGELDALPPALELLEEVRERFGM